MTTIEQMIQREVLCCMSSLVSTLASQWYDGACGDLTKPGRELCEQAFELAAPVLDYEEAAKEAGWRLSGKNRFENDKLEEQAKKDVTTWELLCGVYNIDPYEREAFEHWAVSQWFAKHLQVQGERVDTDFAGLNIWARTTTGQAISMDGVVQKIYREMVK